MIALYVQIAGLTAATVVTLLLVPVLYACFVLDLKLVQWDVVPEPEAALPQLSVHEQPAIV